MTFPVYESLILFQTGAHQSSEAQGGREAVGSEEAWPRASEGRGLGQVDQRRCEGQTTALERHYEAVPAVVGTGQSVLWRGTRTGAWPRLGCGEGNIAGTGHANAGQARCADQGEEPPAGRNAGPAVQGWESLGRYQGEERALCEAWA